MLTNQQLELKALRILDLIRQGGRNEDDHWEFKRELLDPQKAARRLAGHANAAGGEPIYWLIGVDEDAGVVGVSGAVDLAQWVQQVAAQFDEGFPPRLVRDLNVPAAGVAVHLLEFATDRAPYVIKVPGGSGKLEVPWRVGTRVESARRGDLLKMLVPTISLPKYEVLRCSLSCMPAAEKRRWFTDVEVYIKGAVGQSYAIPRHKIAIELIAPHVDFLQGRFDPLGSSPGTSLINLFPEQVLVGGPGTLRLQGECSSALGNTFPLTVRMIVRLPVVEADDQAIVIDEVFDQGALVNEGTMLKYVRRKADGQGS